MKLSFDHGYRYGMWRRYWSKWIVPRFDCVPGRFGWWSISWAGVTVWVVK